jgi:hypothetical protein
MLLLCGEQYRRRYILGHRVPPTSSLLRGVAGHVVVEANMYEKRDRGRLLDEEDIQSRARAVVGRLYERGGLMLMGEERGVGEKNVVELIKNVVQAGSLAHHRELAPLMRPKLIEHPFRLVLKGFPFDLTGRIDIQEEPEYGYTVGTVVDTKFRGRHVAGGAQTSDQMTMYAIWGYTEHSVMVPLRLDTVVTTKTRARCISEKTARGIEDLEVFGRKIEVVADALRKGVFLPAAEGSWKCCEKWCGFWPTCPYVRRRVVCAMPDAQEGEAIVNRLEETKQNGKASGGGPGGKAGGGPDGDGSGGEERHTRSSSEDIGDIF